MLLLVNFKINLKMFQIIYFFVNFEIDSMPFFAYAIFCRKIETFRKMLKAKEKIRY